MFARFGSTWALPIEGPKDVAASGMLYTVQDCIYSSKIEGEGTMLVPKARATMIDYSKPEGRTDLRRVSCKPVTDCAGVNEYIELSGEQE